MGNTSWTGLIRNRKTAKESATQTEAESRVENHVAVKNWLFICIITLPLESEPLWKCQSMSEECKKISKHRLYRSLNSEGTHKHEQAANKRCLHLNKWWKEEGSSCCIKLVQNSRNDHFKMTKPVGKMFQKYLKLSKITLEKNSIKTKLCPHGLCNEIFLHPTSSGFLVCWLNNRYNAPCLNNSLEY